MAVEWQVVTVIVVLLGLIVTVIDPYKISSRWTARLRSQNRPYLNG